MKYHFTQEWHYFLTQIFKNICKTTQLISVCFSGKYINVLVSNELQINTRKKDFRYEIRLILKFCDEQKMKNFLNQFMRNHVTNKKTKQIKDIITIFVQQKLNKHTSYIMCFTSGSRTGMYLHIVELIFLKLLLLRLNILQIQSEIINKQ